MNQLVARLQTSLVKVGAQTAAYVMGELIVGIISLRNSTSTAQKMKFLLIISSVNVSKSAVSCRFGHIYWRNSYGKLHLLCRENSSKGNNLYWNFYQSSRETCLNFVLILLIICQQIFQIKALKQEQAYLETCQITKMELLEKLVKKLKSVKLKF